MNLSPRRPTINIEFVESGFLLELGFEHEKAITERMLEMCWDDNSNFKYDEQVSIEELINYLEFLAERLNSQFKRNITTKQIISHHLQENLSFNNLKKHILENSKKIFFFFLIYFVVTLNRIRE